MIDLVIANARIVDGTGAPSVEGAVAVEGDRILRVMPPGGPVPQARRHVDARGHALAPGFVDVHEHSDLSAFVEPAMESMLRQGVTSIVVGNCGASAYPVEGAPELAALVGADPADLQLDWRAFGTYLDLVGAERPAVNVAALVGHGALRLAALGADQRRPPSRDEMRRMRLSLASALDEGAAGLSTGLIYSPGLHAATDEIVELAAVLADHGGVYASHVRGEGGRVFDAVAECILIGRRAGVPSHVSHLKVEGPAMWGRSEELLALVDTERASGADVTVDQYPYTAWETELASALPPWVTPEELPQVLADPPERERLRVSISEGEPGWETLGLTVGWDRVVLGSFTPDPTLTGRSIEAIARDLGVDPWESVARLLVRDRYAGVVGHGMHEDDVRTIVSREDAFVASDGVAISPHGPLGTFAVHPRYYGTFVRVLGHYVREERLLSLETAVRKMTSLPADRFGLAGRGRIAAGTAADLVVFDPVTVQDRATFAAPHAFAEGVELVVVNGRIAWDGAPGERAGRALRRGER